MTETRRPGTSIPLDSLPNLRDLGGWETVDGRMVRYGMLFRSTALDKLSDDDGRVLADRLGVRTIYDLRTAGEVETAPDRVPDGVAFVNLDVLADDAESSQAGTGDLLADPVAFKQELGGGQNAATYAKGYREIVSLPSAVDGYRRLYMDFMDAGNLAALFHCTTGKDRTGWAAAALLLILGVPEEDVFREFMLTNDQLLPQIKPVFDKFAAAGGDPDDLLPFLGVQRDYLETAFDEMRKQFGTIEGYFDDGLGIDADARDGLREILTVEQTP
jgi:protein-tyrosine phosphatase